MGGAAGAGAHPRAPEGAKTVRDVVTECARLRKHHGGPDFLTLYSFSHRELEAAGRRGLVPDADVHRVPAQGAADDDGEQHPLPPDRPAGEPARRRCWRRSSGTLEETKNNDGLTLVLALNYGSRAEIIDAVRDDRREGEGAASFGREDIERGDDLQPPLHRRHARPGPARPHRRRDAGQQLPPLADQLRRAVRQRRALAGLRRTRPARGDPRVRRAATGGSGRWTTRTRWANGRRVATAPSAAPFPDSSSFSQREGYRPLPALWTCSSPICSKPLKTPSSLVAATSSRERALAAAA